MTNYEYIKNMGIDEMAEFFGYYNMEEDMCWLSNKNMGADFCRTHSCMDCAKKWLESEAKE